MKKVVTIILVLYSILGVAQRKMTSEGEERTRISIKEKQNKAAKDLPPLLLKAWCDGEISAYYPKSLDTKLSYSQFLYHFGMEELAYKTVDNDVPEWFCNEEKTSCGKIDEYTLSCFQFEVELGEENYFNRNKLTQEKRIDYVKLIYSNNCTYTGLELEGPVFKMSDIKNLNKEKYNIQNPINDATTLDIWSFLTIGNFSRSTIFKKNDFVENPARISNKEIQKRVSKENENWEK